MGLDAVLPPPPSGARPGAPAAAGPAQQDGPSFADVLSAADGGAPTPTAAATPAAPDPSAARRAEARRTGPDGTRPGATLDERADAGRDPAASGGASAAEPAPPDDRRGAADAPAHTHVAAHGRGQALAHARARAAAQVVERARAELAGRGDAAPGETLAATDATAALAAGRRADTVPVAAEDAAAAQDAALHAAAAAADPALAPLQPAGLSRDGADRAGAGDTAATDLPDAQGAKATRGLRAPIGGADETARAAATDAASAASATALAGAAQTERAIVADTAAASPAGATGAAAAAAPTSPAALAAALAAGAAAAETTAAGTDAPRTSASGGASPVAAQGPGARHAAGRPQGGPASAAAGASAGAGDAAPAGAAPFPAVQADALRALGERLRSGADGGNEPAPTPTASVFQPLPAGVAAPRADTASDAQAPAGSYPITVPVQDPRFADAFSERVTWLVREGLQGAELTLNPQELGPIRIELALDGDAASIGVIAANAETRGAIEQALPRLREMLSAQGLQLGGAMIDAGSGRAPQGDGGRGRGPRADGRGGIVSLLGDGALAATAGTSPARAQRAGRIDVFA